MRKNRFLIPSLALAASFSLSSCEDDGLLSSILQILDDGLTIVTEDGRGLGWLEPQEDTENIEDDIQINAGDESEMNDETGLPTRVDLTGYLPRIGDQGQFGTCTAWATAYYGRTWLYAKKNGLTTSKLNDNNTSSPGDIFRAIAPNSKGTKCAGSSMEGAMDVLVSRGVASISKAPLISKNAECDCDPSSQADADAANYKIKNYREIDIHNINTIKRYLAEKHIIVFGAQLGDDFMLCQNGSVIKSHGTFNYTGQHACHAITCVGYDDSRNAFRIVNSWGDGWGDNGYCWIDYDFFTQGKGGTRFAYCGFVMYDGDEEEDKPTGDVTIDGDSQIDLIVNKAADTDYDEPEDEDSQDPRWRTLKYNVFNAGSEPVLTADASWGICYTLYNAYNANDFRIILYDLYSEKYANVPKNTCNDNLTQEDAQRILGLSVDESTGASGFAISNFDIPAGMSVANAVNGGNTPSANFSWSYKMPAVSGKYYLVLMADAFGNISESSEDNNYYFLTTADGGPLTIEDGVIKSDIGNNKSLQISVVNPSQNDVMPNQTAVTEKACNTYTPQEISKLIRANQKSGKLHNRALLWMSEYGEDAVKARKIVVD